MGGNGDDHSSAKAGPVPVGLPAELAFLARQGVAPYWLAEAAARAARFRSDPVREAIALGLIDEESFYRALAAELSLPFLPERPRMKAGGSYGAILRGGIAPTAGDPRFRFVLAPKGPALRRMLEAGPRERTDIAVTTPRLFEDGLRLANASGIAQHVAGLDEAGRIRDSARTGASRGQTIAAGLALAATTLGGIFAPLEAFFTLALLLGPIFLGLILLRLAATMEDEAPDLWRSQRWRLDDSRLPTYTVAVAMYREEAVLRQLVTALQALDYPPAKLDIRLLIEADDSGMRAALARMELPAHFTISIVPPGNPRTKPRALNLALLEARGSLFTIFDAEDIPDPQQLRMAAARFLAAPPELACLQARLVIDHAGNGTLPALFALEYAALFEVLNPGLLRFGLPILLGGTSNHFRTQALRNIGGWDAWNVTEDADLGLRLARAGYRMGDLPSNTREEAPDNIPAWLRQRSRWIKGYMQTIVTHSRRPLSLVREAGLAATFSFLSLALGTVVAALGYPAFTVAALIACWNGSLFAPMSALATLTSSIALAVGLFGCVSLFAPPILGALRRGSPELLVLVPLLPLYYALVSVAAWMALYDYFDRRFAWNKTEHGLARRRASVEAVRAFSSEVGTGSREENATKQASRAFSRFGETWKRSTSGAAIRPRPAPVAARY